MALDEAEVVDALLMLGLPATEGAEIFYRPQSKEMVRAKVAREQLTSLTGARETKARRLLEAYAPVADDTDTMQAEGLNSDPARTRKRLKDQMTLLLGLPPECSTGASCIRIARG